VHPTQWNNTLITSDRKEERDECTSQLQFTYQQSMI
jgi:hypothetical protein